MSRRAPADGRVSSLAALLAALPLALFLIAGTAGALWISDDFDSERFAILAYGGVPLAVLYYALLCLYPAWWREQRRLRLALVALLVAAFATGVVPLVNGLSATGRPFKRSFERGTTVVTRDVRRGGLGLLFKTRW